MGAKPYESREEEEEARLGGARRNLERWQERFGGQFSGRASVQRQNIDADGRNEVSKLETVEIGEQPQPAGMTKLPRGTTLEQVSEIFKERDRLKAAMPDASPVTVSVQAVENVKRGVVTPVRVLRYPWVRWLYNLITKEVS